MAVEAPVSRDELLQAFEGAFVLPENVQQERSKPRASALASCARQQAYDMSATPHDPIGTKGSRLTLDSALTAEQGRAFEELMIRTLMEKDLYVVGTQAGLPSYYPVSGHPDGELSLVDRSTGIVPTMGSPLEDGRLWGVEFKHLGRYGYLKTIQKGLRAAHPNYILQAGLYGDALGWDAVLFIVSSQDASSIRAEATNSLRRKTNRWAEDVKDWHPKLHIETMEIREVASGLLPVAKARARWLSNWKQHDGLAKYVAREYDPTAGQFPCTYCPYLSRCLDDGNGGTEAPQLPFKM